MDDAAEVVARRPVLLGLLLVKFAADVRSKVEVEGCFAAIKLSPEHNDPPDGARSNWCECLAELAVALAHEELGGSTMLLDELGDTDDKHDGAGDDNDNDAGDVDEISVDGEQETLEDAFGDRQPTKPELALCAGEPDWLQLVDELSSLTVLAAAAAAVAVGCGRRTCCCAYVLLCSCLCLCLFSRCSLRLVFGDFFVAVCAMSSLLF